MDSSMQVIGNRMQRLAEGLQHIATNVANANTPGFKRVVGRLRDTASGGLALDLSQGPVRLTGRPLDLAIKGSAFFVVDTADGPRYTRKGRLYQNPQGELVDAIGNRFVSPRGTLRIPRHTREITVGTDGEVIADGSPIGALTMVDIPEPRMLVRESWGMLRYNGPRTRDAVDSEVVQGAIEESNVRPLHEMVALIEVTRAYETSSRLLRRMDSMKRQLMGD